MKVAIVQGSTVQELENAINKKIEELAGSTKIEVGTPNGSFAHGYTCLIAYSETAPKKAK